MILDEHVGRWTGEVVGVSAGFPNEQPQAIAGHALVDPNVDFAVEILLTFLVRGWMARPIRAALVAAAASGALGGIIVHLSCDFLGPRHLLIGHLTVPVVLALLALYPLGVLFRRLRH